MLLYWVITNSCSEPTIITIAVSNTHLEHHPRGVTSSCLCKKAEGVVLPLLIESVKDGIEDSLHALHVGEQDHGPGAPADFHEATLDGVGGAQLAPQRLREIEEGQQFGQITLAASSD